MSTSKKEVPPTLRILDEHQPPARACATPGHRGTTFSVAAGQVLYNVGDTCVLMPMAQNAPAGHGPEHAELAWPAMSSAAPYSPGAHANG